MNLRTSQLLLHPKVFLFLLLMAIATGGNSQTPAGMKNPYSGAYKQGSTSAVYLFDDGQFALIGYATFLFGKYDLKGKAIHLEIEQPKDAFVVMGRKEPRLKGKTKLTFNSSFAGIPALIQLEEEPIRLVFDKTTNYVSPHYEVEIAQRPKYFALTLANPDKVAAPNTIVFSPPADFNDFLILYNEPSNEGTSFDGVFEQVDGETVLTVSGQQMAKDTDDVETLTFVQEALAGRELHKNDTLFYFNDQLKSVTGYDDLSEEANIFSRGNYVLDAPSNKLIRKEAYTAGQNYANSVASHYHDETYILQYQLVHPLEKKLLILPKDNPRAKPLMKAKSLD